METTTQEIIFQGLALLVGGVLATIGAYLKVLITTKIDIAKYGFENDRVERIIDNATAYAEQRGNEYVAKYAKEVASSKKLNYARAYINRIDIELVRKYGDKLDYMIERKLEQRILG